MKTDYKVSGMSCGGCAKAVTGAIKAIAPEAEVVVEVNLEAGIVSVDGLDEEAAISQAVEGAGFDFGGRA